MGYIAKAFLENSKQGPEVSKYCYLIYQRVGELSEEGQPKGRKRNLLRQTEAANPETTAGLQLWLSARAISFAFIFYRKSHIVFLEPQFIFCFKAFSWSQD